MTHMKNRILYLCSLAFLAACTGIPENCSKGTDADIFPDYTDITVPVNIAPTNFLIQDNADRYLTILESGNRTVRVKGEKVRIPIRKWRKLTSQGNITVTVYEQKDGSWVRMNPFMINVADEIDPIVCWIT